MKIKKSVISKNKGNDYNKTLNKMFVLAIEENWIPSEEIKKTLEKG